MVYEYGLVYKVIMFQLQPHQERVLTYHTRRILLYHGLGSGKTCTSIALAVAKQQPHKQMIIITPASLVSNYHDELRGSCGTHVGAEYNRFRIVSKDKLYHDYKDRTNVLCQELKNTVIVFDEVHRLLSYTNGKENQFFQHVLDCIGESSACVFLSATPITDPYKLVPLARFLLTPKEFKRSPLAGIRTAKQFFDRYSFQNTIRREQELVDMLKNRVSYFDRSQGPRVTHKDILCYVEPNTVQYKRYQSAMGHSIHMNKTITQEFLLSARQASNLVRGDRVCDRNQLKAHGIKFHTCLESITKRKGPFFVYSNFVTESGVNAFAGYLEHLYHYSDVKRLIIPYQSYAVLRNDEHRSDILERFNHVNNRDGRDINIIIGSPSSAEGLTLKKLREIHILDPHWMPTATDQIVARGVRYGSHNQVNYNEVRVFHYYAIPRDILSVDIHLKQLQVDKRKWLDKFNDVLKRAAIENQPSTSRGPIIVLHNSDSNHINHNNHNHPQPLQTRTQTPKRIRRITQLHRFNPRLLNQYTRRPRKRTIINLTKNNHIVNLT